MALPAVAGDTPLGEAMASWATEPSDATDPSGIDAGGEAAPVLRFGDA
jgi:hypothetical protein